MKSNQNDELAEQLLDTKKSERLKEHVLKTPKKPTAEEKNKAAKQRKDMQDDLGKKFRIRIRVSCWRRSAVGFAAIANVGTLNGVLAPLTEEHAVVAATKAEAGERRFEFLH